MRCCTSAYDALCICGLSKGGAVLGHPNLWRIADDMRYLNIPGDVTQAQGKGPQIEQVAASDRVMPKFTSDAPEGS